MTRAELFERAKKAKSEDGIRPGRGSPFWVETTKKPETLAKRVAETAGEPRSIAVRIKLTSL
jgi:hypothetical protein